MKRGCSRGSISSPLPDRPGAVAYSRVDCKKLSCQRCGPKRAKRYRLAIGIRAQEKELTRMLTLTLDPSQCSVEDSVAYLRKCFSKFRVALLRRFGKSVSYIAVVELQKSGMAHLHVLISVYIDQAWISTAWQAVGGGKIVDIRFVDVRRVTAYVAKYLTKDHLLLVPAKKKRISTSRDIRLFDKHGPSGWTWSSDHIEKIFFRLSHRRMTSVSDVIHDDGGVKAFVAVEIDADRHE